MHECLLTFNTKFPLALKLFSVCLFVFFLGALPCSAQKITMPSSNNAKAVKYYREAAAFYDVRRNQEALDELKKAIEKDKNFIEAYMLMGNIYSDMGDKEKSV